MMLMDSAHIQKQDARYLRKRVATTVEPLYDQEATSRRRCELLEASCRTHEQFEVMPELRVEFLDAGHILGAAIVVLDADSGQHATTDRVHGRPRSERTCPFCAIPDPIPECDALITESTYGNRVHEMRAST